jgi:hypothetical protein
MGLFRSFPKTISTHHHGIGILYNAKDRQVRRVDDIYIRKLPTYH